MVIDHDDADDIAQEVFIKLHSSLKDFRGDSALFTYMYKIAMNYSLNHLKKNKNKQMKELNINDEMLNEIPDKNEEEGNQSYGVRTGLIEKAIASLPQQQRAVFNMRFYDGLSYEEISGIMKKSTGGLKANYFHAFRKIRDYLMEMKEKGKLE